MSGKSFFDRFGKTEASKPAARMQLVSWQEKGPYVNIKYALQWIAPDGTIRIPEQQEQHFKGLSFTAAGKEYGSCRELCARETEDSRIYLDVYGREVFEYKERFPCFDSYDYLYEHRYFRWFHILDGDRLCCVYCEDERPDTRVTEDLRFLRKGAWDEMKEINWQGCADENEEKSI